MADPDPLDELRAQVRATEEAARRLMDDSIPAGGWEAPRERTDAFGEEVQALATLLQATRDLLPEDLREQVTELMRQLLLVVRALIDYAVTRLEESAAASAEGGGRAASGGRDDVQDIPIA